MFSLSKFLGGLLACCFLYQRDRGGLHRDSQLLQWFRNTRVLDVRIGVKNTKFNEFE
jgi:hypothetical protein